jgi:hypothetical protein
MKLTALEIPEDPRDLPHWLERQLVGLDLADLVAELEAVHGSEAARDEPGDLDALLGDRRDAVLERGLSAVPSETLRRLLRRPRLLLDLQERMLISGGDHWRNLVEASEDLRTPFERGRHRLVGITGRPTHEDRDEPRTLRAPGWASSSRLRWAVSLAAAASVLVGSFLYFWGRPKQVEVASGWGWSRPGALPEDGTASVYLNRLADAAEDWFKTRPDEPAALARRIGEFRQGCEVLLQAEHRPLSVVDRDWLVTKCRAWAARLDAHLAALQGGEPVLKVRDEADRTVRQLIDALRQRAKAA